MNRFRVNLITICRIARTLVCLSLLAMWSSAQAISDAANVTDDKKSDAARRRPIMYTFFERISEEQRFTGMTDEENESLLAFWKLEWRAAGWDPQVLNLQDAASHPEYQSLKVRLESIRMDELSRIHILRWIAMASLGGFWCDYDVFPLRDFRDDAFQLRNKGQMTVYGIGGAPTLASGSPEAWLDTARFLVDDAVAHKNPNGGGKLTYWTDTLGMYNAIRSTEQVVHVQRSVLGINKAISEKKLAPDVCEGRPYRGQRVVHVDFTGLLTAAIRPELRLPRHRLTVAREWLPLWRQQCVATPTSD